MAVYHASRARTGILGGGFGVGTRAAGLVASASATLPSASAGATALPRRRTRATARAGRRNGGSVGLVLGGIIVAFLLAFFSLAQTVRVSATSYDIDRLVVERERLEARRQEILNDLNRLGREPAVRKAAIGVGFGPLVDPLIVSAR